MGTELCHPGSEALDEPDERSGTNALGPGPTTHLAVEIAAETNSGVGFAERDPELFRQAEENRPRGLVSVTVLVRVEVRRILANEITEACELCAHLGGDALLRHGLRATTLLPQPTASWWALELQVQADVEPGLPTRVLGGFVGRRLLHHQACAGDDPTLVCFGDPAVDAWAEAEVIGVDDQVRGRLHQRSDAVLCPTRMSQPVPSDLRVRLRKRLRRLTRPAWLGTVRRTRPLSDVWGRDRGEPVDRYYIEQFLDEERSRIRGRVLEMLNSDYTRRFGADVERSDVLDLDARNPDATIVANLTAADAVASDTFDCFILTQTLQFVEDVPAAIGHAQRILRPGGTLLCTVPAVSRIGRSCLGTEYWRFTAASCSLLFERAFDGGEIAVRSRGNVLVAVAFLLGMAQEELRERELEVDDPFFPLIITVRATKAALSESLG
jgi:SAM-dependent methyltransferase